MNGYNHMTMNKQPVLIFAVVIVLIAGAFVYTNRAVAPQIDSEQLQTTSQAIFKIGDATYPINVAPGETVMEAMESLSSAGDIMYTSQEYPGLGAFINSINGQKSDGSNYWMLYVNGTTTSSGVSATTIADGDIVEWRYEKGY